jgi:hypothetical protein
MYGYPFSYNYIEFLDNTYSWDSIRTFIKTGDYEASFGTGEEEIYDKWVEFISSPHPNQ